MEVHISKIRRVWLFYVVVFQRTAKKCKPILNVYAVIDKKEKNQEINIFCQILVTYGYRLPLGVAVVVCDENTSWPLISHSSHCAQSCTKCLLEFSDEARYSYIKLITIITVPGSIQEFIVWASRQNTSLPLISHSPMRSCTKCLLYSRARHATLTLNSLPL